MSEGISDQEINLLNAAQLSKVEKGDGDTPHKYEPTGVRYAHTAPPKLADSHNCTSSTATKHCTFMEGHPGSCVYVPDQFIPSAAIPCTPEPVNMEAIRKAFKKHAEEEATVGPLPPVRCGWTGFKDGGECAKVGGHPGEHVSHRKTSEPTHTHICGIKGFDPAQDGACPGCWPYPEQHTFDSDLGPGDHCAICEKGEDDPAHTTALHKPIGKRCKYMGFPTGPCCKRRGHTGGHELLRMTVTPNPTAQAIIDRAGEEGERIAAKLSPTCNCAETGRACPKCVPAKAGSYAAMVDQITSQPATDIESVEVVTSNIKATYESPSGPIEDSLTSHTIEICKYWANVPLRIPCCRPKGHLGDCSTTKDGRAGFPDHDEIKRYIKAPVLRDESTPAAKKIWQDVDKATHPEPTRPTVEEAREMIEAATKTSNEVLDNLPVIINEAGTTNPDEALPKFMKNEQGNGSGKTIWSLLPFEQLEKVVRVMEGGVPDYQDGDPFMDPANYMGCEQPLVYFNSLMRHVLDWRYGLEADPDSGQPPLAHAVCCALILMCLDDQKKRNE